MLRILRIAFFTEFDTCLSSEEQISRDQVVPASLDPDMRNIIRECIVGKLTILGKTEIPVIASQAHSDPSGTVGNDIIMHADTRHTEKIIVLRTVFGRNLQTDVAAENEVIENLYLLPSVDVDPVGA